MRRIIATLAAVIIAVTALMAADPTVTLYSYDQCLGSSRPYQAPAEAVATPDSLTPVMVNHVGRHGARFPASPAHTLTLRRALFRADSLGTITPLGRELLALTETVGEICHNRWGALDSLGMAEQRGIASRMFLNYPRLFDKGTVRAYSSYAPRCVASMNEFTHQLCRLNNNVEVFTSSGRQNTPLLRPFDANADYTDYIRGKVWETPYNDYAATRITAAPLRRVLGDAYPLTRAETEQLAMAEYQFLASLPAMSFDVDMSRYLTRDEANAAWSCFNLRQYLQRVMTTLSAVPAEIASPLLLDIIRTTDNAVNATGERADVILRFAHAETLLPLVSLLRLDGCYYMTNYFDTVGSHFRDFDIVPMGANLQLALFKDAAGRYLVRVDLNERPIPLIPNDSRLYIPWSEARAYMIRCLPLIDQP